MTNPTYPGMASIWRVVVVCVEPGDRVQGDSKIRICSMGRVAATKQCGEPWRGVFSDDGDDDGRRGDQVKA